MLDKPVMGLISESRGKVLDCLMERPKSEIHSASVQAKTCES